MAAPAGIFHISYQNVTIIDRPRGGPPLLQTPRECSRALRKRFQRLAHIADTPAGLLRADLDRLRQDSGRRAAPDGVLGATIDPRQNTNIDHGRVREGIKVRERGLDQVVCHRVLNEGGMEWVRFPDKKCRGQAD